jgi:ribonuclease P protein component
MPQSLSSEVSRQVLIIAPKRNLKLAVSRNKVKRQMRELYRLQRHRIKPAPQQEVWAIRYLGNRINNYAFMEKAFIELIEKYNEQRQEAS